MAWPSIERAHDQWLARSLAEGDPSALPEIYDAYAPRLFDYCHGLLCDEESAGSALRATLLAIQARIGGEPETGPFRGRLYATTRGECLRRRAGEGTPSRGRVAATEGDAPDVDDETRRLVRTALLMLDGPRREVLDLAFRHELDPYDLGEVFSAEPHEASVRVARACADLDEVFAAVEVSANGREDCPAVAALAGSIEGPLTPEAFEHLLRHIPDCPACVLHGGPRPGTARLLRAMPTAALPEALRAGVLTAVAPAVSSPSPSPGLEPKPKAKSAAVTRVVTCTEPMPIEPRPMPADRRASPYPWLAFAVAAFGLFIAGAVFLVMPEDEHTASGEQPIALPRDPAAGGASSSSPAESSPAKPTPTPKPSKSTKSPSPSPSSSSPPAQRPTSSPTHPHSRPPAPGPSPGRLDVFGCHVVSYERCSI